MLGTLCLVLLTRSKYPGVRCFAIDTEVANVPSYVAEVDTGANTALYTIIDGVLLEPLAFQVRIFVASPVPVPRSFSASLDKR